MHFLRHRRELFNCSPNRLYRIVLDVDCKLRAGRRKTGAHPVRFSAVLPDSSFFTVRGEQRGGMVEGGGKKKEIKKRVGENGLNGEIEGGEGGESRGRGTGKHRTIPIATNYTLLYPITPARD